MNPLLEDKHTGGKNEVCEWGKQLSYNQNDYLFCLKDKGVEDYYDKAFLFPSLFFIKKSD